VLRGHRSKVSGLLTVSASSTFGKLFIAPLLPRFRKRYPELRLRLQFTAKKVQIGVGEADIAIRLGPIVDPNLGVRKLGQIDFCLVASPRYLKARSMPKHPADLVAHDMIELRPPAGDHSLELHRQRKSQIIRYLPKVSLDEPETAKLMCVAAAGIAPLPVFLATGEMKSGALLRILDNWTVAPAPINLVYASEAGLNTRVQAFLNFVAEAFADNLPWQS
jgi:DNA-binding transcriptional LysR family regulator